MNAIIISISISTASSYLNVASSGPSLNYILSENGGDMISESGVRLIAG